MTTKVCGLVPIYNNHMTIERVIETLLLQFNFIIVVDDGSNDGSEVIVETLKGKYPNRVDVLHHKFNSGKGSAVQSGLQHANRLGFTHALQVDADGQHDLNDLSKFSQAVKDYPTAMLVGVPIYSDDIPNIRKYGRKLTQAMIMLEMGRWNVPDAMIGYRVYPVEAVCALGKLDQRMSFDPEVMIRGHWAGIPLHKIPTRICYPTVAEGGISHFKMFDDNARHTWLHIRLVLQAPFRLLLRKLLINT